MKIPVDKTASKQLMDVSKAIQYAPELLAADILASYFNADYASMKSSENGKRATPRKESHIECAIQIPSRKNEILYTSAIIKNLSLGGIYVEISARKQKIITKVEEVESFDAIFSFPCSGELLLFSCQTKHAFLEDKLVIGGAFITPELYSLRRLLQFLLASSCSTASGRDTCRGCLHMSELATGYSA